METHRPEWLTPKNAVSLGRLHDLLLIDSSLHSPQVARMIRDATGNFVIAHLHGLPGERLAFGVSELQENGHPSPCIPAREWRLRLQRLLSDTDLPRLHLYQSVNGAWEGRGIFFDLGAAVMNLTRSLPSVLATDSVPGGIILIGTRFRLPHLMGCRKLHKKLRKIGRLAGIDGVGEIENTLRDVNREGPTFIVSERMIPLEGSGYIRIKSDWPTAEAAAAGAALLENAEALGAFLSFDRPGLDG